MKTKSTQCIGSAGSRATGHAAGRTASRQRGVVLFIALIVLVAMTLAGIAIMRSVDTGNLVAGNMAFKQSTLSAADSGIASAFLWLTTTINAGATYATLEQDVGAQGYHAVVSDPPGTPPDWTPDAVWAGQSLAVGTDAAGNTVDYIIHRMCNSAGIYSSASCAQTPTLGAQSGGSMAVGGGAFHPPPMVYYRVTVRVRGARETLSVVQSVIGLQQ